MSGPSYRPPHQSGIELAGIVGPLISRFLSAGVSDRLWFYCVLVVALLAIRYLVECLFLNALLVWGPGTSDASRTLRDIPASVGFRSLRKKRVLDFLRQDRTAFQGDIEEEMKQLLRRTKHNVSEEIALNMPLRLMDGGGAVMVLPARAWFFRSQVEQRRKLLCKRATDLLEGIVGFGVPLDTVIAGGETSDEATPSSGVNETIALQDLYSLVARFKEGTFPSFEFGLTAGLLALLDAPERNSQGPSYCNNILRTTIHLDGTCLHDALRILVYDLVHFPYLGRARQFETLLHLVDQLLARISAVVLNPNPQQLLFGRTQDSQVDMHAASEPNPSRLRDIFSIYVSACCNPRVVETELVDRMDV